MANSIIFERVRDDVRTPSYGTGGSAGIDFYIPEGWIDEEPSRLEVLPNADIVIPSGFKVKMPKGTCLVGFNKSGIALRGLIVGACVVDEDYEGEFMLHLINPSSDPIIINPIKRIAQFILLKYERPEIVVGEITDRETYDGNRGCNGFGSTR
jgi:dUTP pyrophosphatase